jgi:hydrogenase maturation protein HypF
LPLARNSIGLWETDWSPLLTQLLDTGRPQEERAGSFHASLAQALTDQALTLRMQGASHNVGLCGGVFQNRLLTELVCARLRAAGFTVYLGELVPCNDAGISYGQIIDAGRTAKS